MSLPIYFALSCVFSVTSASGVLWLKMIQFDNPGGKDNAGLPCDEVLLFIPLSECDHKFRICIDSAYGSNQIYSCRYGDRQTTRISNRDRITFSSSVGGIRNPMTFAFKTWPGRVKIKVEVWDDDKNNNQDYVDFLSKVFSSSPSSRSAYGERLTLQSRTKLQLQVKIYCDTYYYGYNCGTYCRQRNDRYGHYTCHWKTGAKICMQGWMGHSCQIRNFCSSAPCNNDGICENLKNGFVCHCTDRFTGKTREGEAIPDTATLITSTNKRDRQQNCYQHQTFATVDKGVITTTPKSQETVIIATCVTGGFTCILVSACVAFICFRQKKKTGSSSRSTERGTEREERHIYDEIYEYGSVKTVPKSSSNQCSENVYYKAPPQSTSENSFISLASEEDVHMRDGGIQNHESEKYDDFIDIVS